MVYVCVREYVCVFNPSVEKSLRVQKLRRKFLGNSMVEEKGLYEA